jgi:hypothetical protein
LIIDCYSTAHGHRRAQLTLTLTRGSGLAGDFELNVLPAFFATIVIAKISLSPNFFLVAAAAAANRFQKQSSRSAQHHLTITSPIPFEP